MNPSFATKCTSCNETILLPVESKKQKVKCPKCGRAFFAVPVSLNEPGATVFEKVVMMVGLGGLGLIVLIVVVSALHSCGTKRVSDKHPQEIVENSSWDGSVSQVKEWLEANAKDPRSIEYAEWSPVEKTAEGFVVRCKFRAKNSFGGMNLENKVFYMDSMGKVVGVKDF